MRLVLASQSPRRRELLAAAGYTFEVHAVDVDERLHAGETPPAYVERLAIEKGAQAMSEMALAPEDIVLAADTAVVAGGRILGKPRDPEDGARMLRLLSGRAHQVVTGVSVRSGGKALAVVEGTTVWFSPLDDEQIASYVASGEGSDKAGGYAIQGLASRFIPRIEGSYSNVVGLPIATVTTLIHRLGRSPRVLASGG